MIFKMRYQEEFGHLRVTMFIGPDIDNLAMTGVVVFRKGEEEKAFKKLIRDGAWLNPEDIHLIENDESFDSKH